MKIPCPRTDCFRNSKENCELLQEEPEDAFECSFFATPLEVADKQAKSHRRLIELGRPDLVKKYELNPQRTW